MRAAIRKREFGAWGWLWLGALVTPLGCGSGGGSATPGGTPGGSPGEGQRGPTLGRGLPPRILLPRTLNEARRVELNPQLRPLTGPTVGATLGTYAASAPMTINWSGLASSNPASKITIGPASAPNTTILSSQTLGGLQSGTLTTFTAPADDGSYVAWLWQGGTGGSTTEVAESVPFTVTSGPTPTVSADHITYAPGATITATFSGLDMAPFNLIAVAPVGAPYYGVSSRHYTGQLASGTVTLPAPTGNGTYVLRALDENSWAILAQATATFTVAGAAPAAVNTTATTYTAGAQITATFAGLDTYDQVVLAAAGSASYDIISTQSAAHSPVTFTAPPANGSYVVRALADGTTNVVAESPTPFTVTGGTSPTISRDAASYTATTGIINVTYSGLDEDWNMITVAPAGSVDADGLGMHLITKSAGTLQIAAPASNGTYVVRELSPASVKLAESAPFTVTGGASPQVVANHPSYAPGATITATYSGFDGDVANAIGLQRQGDPDGYGFDIAWHTTGTNLGGTLLFTAPPTSGNYVFVALHGETNAVMTTSNPFSVTGTTVASVSADQAAYLAGQTITATFAGLDGAPYNEVVIAGSAGSGTQVAYAKAGSLVSGSVPIVAPPVTGTYYAYVLTDASWSAVVAQSASSFTICDPGEACTPSNVCNTAAISCGPSPSYAATCVDTPVADGTSCGSALVCEGGSCVSSSCTAQTLNGDCNVSATTTGNTSGICAGDFVGSCTYACTNGTWSQVGDSCQTTCGTVTDLSQVGTGDFNIAFDLQTTDVGQFSIASQRNSCGGAGSWYDLTASLADGRGILAEVDDGTNYTVACSNGSCAQTFTDTGLADGNVHHVVVARVSGQLSITIDGTSRTSVASAADLTSMQPLSIGSSPCDDGVNETTAPSGAVANFVLADCPPVTCTKVVTSTLSETNPYTTDVAITYSMIGGGGGGGGAGTFAPTDHMGGGGGGSSAITSGAFSAVAAGGAGSDGTGPAGANGTYASASFTLSAGASIAVTVGGGGGGGFQFGGGGGGAGDYGGGGGGSYGSGGGGGGSTSVGGAGGGGRGVSAGSGQAGGNGYNSSFGYGGTGGTSLGAGGSAGRFGGGGGGGFGGGGGGYASAGGSNGASGSGAAGAGAGGLGANTWSAATSFPAAAGAGAPASTHKGGNAGFVMLTYKSPNGSCSL